MKKTNALRQLAKHKIPFDIINYQYDPENLSVEKIANENGLILQQIYKTLVVKGDKTGIVVALIAGHQSLSLKKLAKYSSNKKMALTAVKDLQALTGYIRGGCSPIGMKKQYPIYIDEMAKTQEKIYVNAGTRGILFGCSPEALKELCKATWVDIAEQ